MDEQRLVRRARRGDTEAFAHLVRIHERSLYSTAYGILRSQWDAADAVQDTFAEALSKIRGLREPKKFGAWLSRILVNKCRDTLRAGRPVIVVAETPEPRPAHSYVGTEDGLDLMAALQALDEDQRAVVTLRFFRDMKIDEIANVLGCPAGTVKSRLNRALARLHETLEPAADEPNVTYLEVAR